MQVFLTAQERVPILSTPVTWGMEGKHAIVYHYYQYMYIAIHVCISLKPSPSIPPPPPLHHAFFCGGGGGGGGGGMGRLSGQEPRDHVRISELSWENFEEFIVHSIILTSRMKTFQEMYINVGMANREKRPNQEQDDIRLTHIAIPTFFYFVILKRVFSQKVYVLISYTGGVCCRCSFCRRLIGAAVYFLCHPYIWSTTVLHDRAGRLCFWVWELGVV